MYKYRFSVFTATYNRALSLPVVYDCLLKQSFKSFEWIIVNDGSKDDTDQVCAKFIDDGILDIKYIRKENGGKHTAWRVATKEFEGQYVVGADDDDLYPVDMLKILDYHWSQLEKREDYSNFWEVKGRCADGAGSLVGKPLPMAVFDSDYNTVFFIMKHTYEMQGCRKVEVLRYEAAVPEHFIYDENCSNFPEGIRWSRAARFYKTRFIDEVLRIYNSDTTGRLCSKNSGAKRNARITYNTLVGSIYNLIENRDLLIQYNKIFYIKNLAILTYTSICLKKNPFVQCRLTLFEKACLLFMYLPLYCVHYFRR